MGGPIGAVDVRVEAAYSRASAGQLARSLGFAATDVEDIKPWTGPRASKIASTWVRLPYSVRASVVVSSAMMTHDSGSSHVLHLGQCLSSIGLYRPENASRGSRRPRCSLPRIQGIKIVDRVL